MDIFNIKIEFDSNACREAIDRCIDENGKGYICVVDFNVLTITQQDPEYRNIVYGSYLNVCDGSTIAAMANFIYGTNYRVYTGPQIFEGMVERKNVKQLLLGNTEETYNKIKNELKNRGIDSSHLMYMPVPFASVDEFDYPTIAEQIKEMNPNVIWVSLGAPKQERFMNRLLPYLDKGLMFGIGAAFNFYVGEIRQPKFHIGALRFIWVDRIIHEPKKQFGRIRLAMKAYPILFVDELRKKRKLKKKQK